MNNKETETTPRVASKSFMTAGPTLHYSHKNVQRCWVLAMVVYALICLFWNKILTGSFWSFNFSSLVGSDIWGLGRAITGGVSIFEYPWQILILGMLMGALAVAPVLVSQLLSFSYSAPFILMTMFLGNLPGLAVGLLISCIAVASRPLRFRSRFIAIALCITPQFAYWGYFGGARGLEPLRFGFSFTPWICAWLVCLAIAGVVIAIGHFTRYKPGLVWAVSCAVLLTAVMVFEIKIGFDELDYQLYVAKNNPQQVKEFHENSITEALDATIDNKTVKKYLSDFFYPSEEIPLRKELKKEIQIKLSYDRWPNWFIVPDALNYQSKKQWLFEQYDSFINRRDKSPSMPIALYYKALLSEYTVDLKALEQKDLLRFYSDYAHERSRPIWYRLYSEFGDSAESIEARWRIAKNWAGQGKFAQAEKLLTEAQAMAQEELPAFENDQKQSNTFFGSFRPPAASAMTEFKVVELQRKLNQLRSLISSENRDGNTEREKCLAEFIMLNPHSLRFDEQLHELLSKMKDDDPLRDNVLLAQVKLIADDYLRAEKLAKLHKKFQNTDGGTYALYELGLLKIDMWRKQDKSNTELKRKFLSQARAILTEFVSLYPNSFCSEQVRKNLENLPSAE